MTTNLVIDAQEKLARRQRLDRIWRAGWAVSWLRTSMASTEFAAHRAENGHAGHSRVPDAVGLARLVRLKISGCSTSEV